MMIPHPFKAAILTLLAAAMPGSPGDAQEFILSADPMVQARAAEVRHDPAEALSRYLRVLSTRPKDLEALTGAGNAALDIGDPSAAIGFYARAEEIAPRNGRVKAGLGSAMLQMENPKAALRLFGDAVDLGVPVGEVASDRGLAYDLRGDNKRAQQEYALALKTVDEPETRRRLALSLAMTGDRIGALLILDPLLRRQDIPAWRVRAFVLALTGDAAGAEKAALSVMPGPQATALLPFLTRLPGLKPQQQAAAVHFGHFPSDGRTARPGDLLADASSAPQPAVPGADSQLIPAGPPLGRSVSANSPPPVKEPVSIAPRRRPGGSEDRLASVMASILSPPAPPVAETMATRPAPVVEAKPAPAVTAVARDPFVGPPDAANPTITAQPGFTSLPVRQPVQLAQAQRPAAQPIVPVKKPVVVSGKDEAKDAAASKDPKAKDVKAKEALASKTKDGAAEKDKDPKAKDSKSKDSKSKDADAKDAKSKDAKAKGPERYWVQVAGGANKTDLPKAFAKLKEKSPKLFAGRSAWTTPLRATNRLLIGPFKTSAEAQEFVNTAGKEKQSAFTYTSPAGQDVEKLPAK
jgi:Flp pilus assembly protein TadD